MKKITAFMAICASFTLLSPLAVEAKMRISAYYQIYYPPSGRVSPYPVAIHHIEIWIKIENTGTEKLTVPTSGYQVREDSKGDILNVRTLFDVSQSVTGVNIKISDSNYGIVSLDPGEITEIHFSTGPLEIAPSSITAGFEVATDLAKMHNIWAGKLEAKAVDLTAMYMPKAKPNM